MSTRSRNRERGSAVIEAVIGVPAFGLFVALIILAGRVAIAHQAVEAAAAAAARAASIARTQGQAQTSAAATAAATLRDQSLTCVSPARHRRHDRVRHPRRHPRTVSATVTCVVELSDLALPGVPGTRTVTVTVTSPLDTYRER